MKSTKRRQKYEQAPVTQDVIAWEDPAVGLVALDSPNDPRPSIKIVDGQIVEMDGKTRDEFDFIDKFIVKYGINVSEAETSMALDSAEIAKMLVDINVSRRDLLKIASGLTPAKLVDVVSKMNVVEIMMAQMKMRARKSPANQAHVTNLLDNPVLMAADAAEAALRGFAELETTCSVTRCAPLNAIALMIGSQVGRPGVITQCSLEEATELKIGMKGFTSYAETVSVYGTEAVMSDGDDTPWSKSFLASAYAARGMKMRFSSGTGSEVMMGYAEGKSMLYLEARCVWMVKAGGSQGTQNGSIDGLPLSSSMPSGLRAVAAENLLTSMLGLEVASGNDTYFSHSLARSMSKLLMQMLPGTDLVTSGYASIPNCDNTFSASTMDCDNYANYYMVQRDMKVDGALHPVSNEEVIAHRRKAAQAMQALFYAMDFPEITDEEVEAAVYAYKSSDMPKRNVAEDIKAATHIMESDFNGFDIVKVLYQAGYEELAENILTMLKQRVAGDYLHTSAIFDENFHVISAINNENDYAGPTTGYQISDARWDQMQQHMGAVSTDDFIDSRDESYINGITECGPAAPGTNPDEVVIAVSPSFGQQQRKTIVDLPHEIVLRELAAGIEEEGMKPRFIKCYSSSDLAVISSAGSRLSGSGISIGIQSRGTTVIHQKDLVPLDNLELFPQSPLYDKKTYRAIGKNAAKYAKGESPEPLPGDIDSSTRFYMLKTTLLHNHETAQIKNIKPVELEVSFI